MADKGGKARLKDDGDGADGDEEEEQGNEEGERKESPNSSSSSSSSLKHIVTTGIKHPGKNGKEILKHVFLTWRLLLSRGAFGSGLQRCNVW